MATFVSFPEHALSHHASLAKRSETLGKNKANQVLNISEYTNINRLKKLNSRYLLFNSCLKFLPVKGVETSWVHLPPDPVTVTGLSMGNPPTSPPGHVGKRLRPSIHPESTTLQLEKSKQKWKGKNSCLWLIWVYIQKIWHFFYKKNSFESIPKTMAKNGNMSLTKIPLRSIFHIHFDGPNLMVGLFVKVPLSSPPWLGMNCTCSQVSKMPGRFATWPCILILFYDPGLTPYIPKFWSFFSFHQLFGSTRWLAHQIPAPARATGKNAGTKNTKGWRNHKIYCHSMKDFNEVIENVWKPDGKIKKTTRNQIQ